MTSPVPSDTNPLPLPNPEAILAEVTDGAVLYLPETEHYFGLTPVAAQVWQLLPPACQTLGEVCRSLAERYPDVPMDTLRQDVSELLEALERMHLVTTPISA